MNGEFLYGTNFVVLDSMGREKKRYMAETVARGIDKFIQENFRGLAETSIDLPSDAELFISMESLALFFKEVLNFVMGRALLKMRFFSDRDKIIIHLFSEPPLTCSFEEATRFIMFARDIGLDLCRIDGVTVFIIDCFEKKRYTVYAPLVKDDAKIISQIFENAFYKNDELLK